MVLLSELKKSDFKAQRKNERYLQMVLIKREKPRSVLGHQW